MTINEDASIEIDGKTFPNSYKANEYLNKKVEPLQKQIGILSSEISKLQAKEKQLKDQLRGYYEFGKKIQAEFDRDMDTSRKIRGPVGHDVDSDKHVKWLENVRRNLYN